MDYDDSYLNLPTCIRLWEPKKPDTTHTFIYSLCVSIFLTFWGIIILIYLPVLFHRVLSSTKFFFMIDHFKITKSGIIFRKKWEWNEWSN